VAESTDPLSNAYAAYEQFEAKLSTAMDQLVATNGFAELFTTSATTMMALSRMVNGAIDQAVRGTRLAARQDVTSLARQLARTEDKLERMLQAIEAIESRLDDAQPGGGTAPAAQDSRPEAPRRATVKRSVAKRPAAGRAAAKSTGSTT
jgi:BMFP domain-containing protein YqiC